MSWNLLINLFMCIMCGLKVNSPEIFSDHPDFDFFVSPDS